MLRFQTRTDTTPFKVPERQKGYYLLMFLLVNITDVMVRPSIGILRCSRGVGLQRYTGFYSAFFDIFTSKVSINKNS